MKFESKKSMELSYSYKFNSTERKWYAIFPAAALSAMLNELIEEFGEKVVIDMELSHEHEEDEQSGKTISTISTVRFMVQHEETNTQYPDPE